MNGIKALGLKSANRNFFMSFLSAYLLGYQVTLAFGVGMISTTVRPPKGLTTPRNSADNKATIKAEISDFMNLAMSMQNLKMAEDMLTNSSLIQKMEKELTAFQDIVNTIERYYRFGLTQSVTKMCSYEYARGKANLLQEFSALLNDCKETLDNIDVLHFSHVEKHDKIIIHGCSERAKTIPMDVTRLFEHIYQISHVCAVESARSIIEEMAESKYFSFIGENSMLLLQELEYILGTYEGLSENRYQKENKPESIWNMIKTSKIELAAIKGVVQSKETKNAVKNFTNVVELVLNSNHTTVDSSKEHYRKLSKALQEVFESYLKIPHLEDNSVENWNKSYGLYKIVFMNNLLKEIMAKIALTIPKSDKFRTRREDWENAKLYTEISPTFGKPCEHSPNHLVGTCSAENHEICRYVVENWGVDDDHVLLRNEEFIMLDSIELKHCTCGFRADCGNDESESSRGTNCFLIPNKEGQCRGAEEYPCRTHPLEYGKYDDSCASGYCNLEKNSCEAANGSAETVWKKVKRFKKVVREKLGDLAEFLR